MRNADEHSDHYILLDEEPNNPAGNTSSSSRSPEETIPTSNQPKFQPILDTISEAEKAEKPKITKCPGDAISIAAMLVFGASAYLFRFLQITYTTSHSNKMNEWQYQAQPSNATCDNILGEISNYGIVLPYILNISQNSSELLQSCTALQESISTLNANASISQGAMIMSFTLLAITTLNCVATIKNRILINKTNEPEFNDKEKKLLKGNSINPDVALMGTSRIKESILLHPELSKHVGNNATGIILDYYQPSLKMAIHEKSLKATTKSAKILRIFTAFLTKQSTPLMALTHALGTNSPFIFIKCLNEEWESKHCITKAEEIWSHSLIPNSNYTCFDLHGECQTGGLGISIPTIEQPCEKICQFIGNGGISGWPWLILFLSVVVFSLWLIFATQNPPKDDPIPLDTILTKSELTFLRGCNITENRLTPDVVEKIAQLAKSQDSSDEEEKSDVGSYGGGPPLVNPSIP